MRPIFLEIYVQMVNVGKSQVAQCRVKKCSLSARCTYSALSPLFDWPDGGRMAADDEDAAAVAQLLHLISEWLDVAPYLSDERNIQYVPWIYISFWLELFLLE